MRQSLAANLSRSGAKVAPVRPGLVVQSLSSSVPAVDAGLTVSTPTPPSNPPPNIPANYVLTGGGWEHPSCVHTVPNGSTVELDGTVTLDGKLVEKLTPCAYTQYPTTPGSAPIPPYASTSEATSPVKPQAAPRSASSGGLHADTESSPAGSWWGWTENTFQSDYSYGFDEVYANITVPPLPTTPQGILYYFNGLTNQDTTTCPGIMQPELVYSPGPAQQSGWPAAGFYLNSEFNDSQYGNVNSGLSSAVSVGDTIESYLYIYAYNGSTGTFYYYIYNYDTTSGDSTLLAEAVSCAFNQAYPATMEVGNGAISSCNNVPDDYVNFTDISPYQPYPSWNSYDAVTYSPTNQITIGEPNQDPNCYFNIGNSGGTTTLWQ